MYGSDNTRIRYLNDKGLEGNQTATVRRDQLYLCTKEQAAAIYKGKTRVEKIQGDTEMEQQNQPVLPREHFQ